MKRIVLGDDEDEGNEDFSCPFCKTLEDCEHMLLIADKTSHTAEGGSLRNSFNRLWGEVLEEKSMENDPDFSERDLFEDFLDDVRAVSDVEVSGSLDGAPGMSSSCSYFFCSSAERTAKAIKAFERSS